MAKIIVEIPDNVQAGWLFQGISKKWNYSEIIDGQPNPETKLDFIGKLLTEYLINEGIQGYMIDKNQELRDLAAQVIITYSNQ